MNRSKTCFWSQMMLMARKMMMLTKVMKMKTMNRRFADMTTMTKSGQATKHVLRLARTKWINDKGHNRANSKLLLTLNSMSAFVWNTIAMTIKMMMTTEYYEHGDGDDDDLGCPWIGGSSKQRGRQQVETRLWEEFCKLWWELLFPEEDRYQMSNLLKTCFPFGNKLW